MANRLLIIESDMPDSKELEKRYQDKGWQVDSVKEFSDAIEMLTKHDLNPHVVCAGANAKTKSLVENVLAVDACLEYSEWVFLVDKEDCLDDSALDDVGYNFIEKNFKPKQIDLAINRAIRTSLTARRLDSFSSQQLNRNQLESFLGNSDAVVELKDMLKKLSDVPISTMIITGETGTGKGLVARILHHIGVRKDGPMIELNCAALPKDLLESQLFGHEAGAFTGAKGRYRGLFEQADNGTLFLDEIGDMDIDLQAKLLKAIEDKKIRRVGGTREISVDVQIIAATAKDLKVEYSQKNFREDLYHRLSVFCVTLPPLRKRKTDLVELVPHIIAEFNAVSGRKVEVVNDEVWEALLAYDWPGNVRELRNVIERCVLMSGDEVFPIDWLQLKSHCSPENSEECPISTTDSVNLPLDGSMTLEEMDSHIIQVALRENEFNITETARVLKTTRETVRYRIQKYSLQTSA